MATTNALPLKSTARPALALAVEAASRSCRPSSRSSRYRETIKQRVVDPQREPHPVSMLIVKSESSKN